MSTEAGQLLISRQRLTLAEGLTTVDTGLIQQNLGVSPDPPLGGTDATPDTAATPSRVQVTPLAPAEPWITGNVHHGEPYVDPTTGTVFVDFWVAAGTGEQEVLVEFWDPHTAICPIDCEGYAPITCTTPVDQQSNFLNQGAASASGIADNPAIGDDGQLVVVIVAVRFEGGFGAGNPIVADDAGWTTQETASADLGGGNGIQFAVFTRISTAADPATYSFSWTMDTDTAWFTASNAYASVDPTTPVASDASQVDNIAPATDNPFLITAPSLTAEANAPLLVTVWLVDGQAPGNIGNPNPPTGIMVQQQSAGGQPAMSMVVFTWPDAMPAGATGIRTTEYSDDASAGIGFAMLIAPVCGIFPDGSNP